MGAGSVSFWKAVTTLFFIGYLPVAPGTFGTLAGLLFVWGAGLELTGLIAAAVIAFVAGTIGSGVVERELGQRDPGFIVIDEFVGYLVAVAGLPQTGAYLVSAFFLFRFFDILKPRPIRDVEEHVGGGLGIMLDDVLAGLITNAVLQVWRLL
jgi:phosphatidylglycerophosphatase A